MVSEELVDRSAEQKRNTRKPAPYGGMCSCNKPSATQAR
jgi:hypothetical protein